MAIFVSLQKIGPHGRVKSPMSMLRDRCNIVKAVPIVFGEFVDTMKQAG